MKKRTKYLVAAAAVLLLTGTGALAWKQAQKRSEALETSRRDAQTAVEKSESEEDASVETITYDGVTYRYKEDIRSYLLMGIDKTTAAEKDNAGRSGQADTITLLVRDERKKKLKILEIPRDTMTQIEVYDAQGKSLGMTEDHINIQYAYGDGRGSSCRLMTEAVSNLLYQIPVHGYCAMMMNGIAVLNDAVGGVTVTVPQEGFSFEGQQYEPGTEVILSGAMAESFVRYRDTDESLSSMKRMENQNVFLEAWMCQAQEAASKDAGFAARLYMALEPYLVTDMGNDLFAELLQDASAFEKEKQMLPGSGSAGEHFDEYHVDENALYELVLEMFYEEVK